MKGLDGIMDSTEFNSMSLSKLQEIVKDRGAWRAAVHRVAKSRCPPCMEPPCSLNNLKNGNQQSG